MLLPHRINTLIAGNTALTLMALNLPSSSPHQGANLFLPDYLFPFLRRLAWSASERISKSALCKLVVMASGVHFGTPKTPLMCQILDYLSQGPFLKDALPACPAEPGVLHAQHLHDMTRGDHEPPVTAAPQSKSVPQFVHGFFEKALPRLFLPLRTP